MSTRLSKSNTTTLLSAETRTAIDRWLAKYPPLTVVG